MAKVLIVDDQNEILDTVSISLQYFGHETKKARTGAELYKVMEQFQPSLIILDVMLGDEDGRQICRDLKASTYGSIPILLYSAAADLLFNFREYNADAAVEKPFDIFALNNKVIQLTGG